MRTRTELLDNASRIGRQQSASKDTEPQTIDFRAEVELEASVIADPVTILSLEIHGQFGPAAQMLARTVFEGGTRDRDGFFNQPRLGVTFQPTDPRPDSIWILVDSRQRYRYSCSIDEGN